MRGYADFYANSMSPRATLADAGYCRCAECRSYFEHERCTAVFCSELCRVKAWQKVMRERRENAAKENAIVRVMHVCSITQLDRAISEAVLNNASV
jgi:hypothetical protein